MPWSYGVDPSSRVFDDLAIKPGDVSRELTSELHLHGCLLEFWGYVSQEEEGSGGRYGE